jgi:hypothetical protein
MMAREIQCTGTLSQDDRFGKKAKFKIEGGPKQPEYYHLWQRKLNHGQLGHFG